MFMSIIFAVKDYQSWVPLELHNAEKYQFIDQVNVSYQKIRFTRKSDESVIAIECEQSTNERAAQPFRVNPDDPNVVIFARDGNPIASQYWSNWHKTQTASFAVGRLDRVTFSITAKIRKEGQFRVIEERPFELDVQWVENKTRQVLASWASRRLSDEIQSTPFKTLSLQTRQTQQGTTMVDLTDYSTKGGFDLTVNPQATTCTFTVGENNYVAPLGSYSIKRNDTWHEMPDLVMLKEGRFYVPLSAFDPDQRPSR